MEVAANFTPLLDAYQLAKCRWGLIQHRDAFVHQKLVERFGRARRAIGHDDELAAIEQGTPQLPDREVKGVRMEQCPDVVCSKTVPSLRCQE